MAQRKNSTQNLNTTTQLKKTESNQSNYSNQRCNSYQSLVAPEMNNSNSNNHTAHLSHTTTCPEKLDSLPGHNSNTPRLVPSISVTSSDSNDESNQFKKLNRVRQQMCKLETRIISYFKPNFRSKSPNPPRNNEESNFKSYVPPIRPPIRNGISPSSSLGRTNGYNQSISLQEVVINGSNGDELKNLTINGNENRTAGSNVKLVTNSPSKLYKNFVYDSETKAEIKKMLDKIPIDERIKLQERNYSLLKKQCDINSVKLSEIKSDIDEIKNDLNNLNEPFKSAFEIEQLRGEIRALANEKADLEYKLSKKISWACAQCTFASNKSDVINCTICSTERDENEIFRCLFCGTKNPLCNRNCMKCDTFFNSASKSTDQLQFHKRKSSSSSSSSLSSASYKTSPVLSTPVPNYQNYSHSNGASAQSRGDYPTHSPVLPKSYLNTANTYQFN